MLYVVFSQILTGKRLENENGEMKKRGHINEGRGGKQKKKEHEKDTKDK